ncbi:hypothetical protein Tco_1375358 [Tanacetum coccineum]
MTVANKMAAHVSASFRRLVRGGIEQQQLSDLVTCMDSVSHDRWVCSISGDGSFSVKDIRNSLDDLFLPSWPEPTRWVKSIPIKINVFTWRARRLIALPTRSKLNSYKEVLVWIPINCSDMLLYRGCASLRFLSVLNWLRLCHENYMQVVGDLEEWQHGLLFQSGTSGFRI